VRRKPLDTPTDLSSEAVNAISAALNAILADSFALYFKTKNFHWHVSGPHFRDYHLLLDEQAEQILSITDEIAERVRKIGGITLKSIGQIAGLQRIKDNGRPTRLPTSTRTSRLRANSRSISTAPKSASGSCSRQAARPTGPAIDGRSRRLRLSVTLAA
jgi:starvation-inducible DNA-binding protein